MGQTAGGLPWPEDSDAVMAGAQAIRALAEAVDGRPWYQAFRQATFSQGGGGADTTVGSGSQAWETIESNFTPGDAQGFIAPRAGLWEVSAQWGANGAWAGQLAGCAVTCSGGKEVGTQHFEAGSGGNNRRSWLAWGVVRLAVGETVRMVVWSNMAATAGGAQRYQTRFAARWIAP